MFDVLVDTHLDVLSRKMHIKARKAFRKEDDEEVERIRPERFSQKFNF